MKLRELFQRFRFKRSRQVSISDSVSFEAFCNESPRDRLNTDTKDSSLNGDVSISPAAGGFSQPPPRSFPYHLYTRFSKRRQMTCCDLLILAVIVLIAIAISVRPIMTILHGPVLHVEDQVTSVPKNTAFDPGLPTYPGLIIPKKKVNLPSPPPPDYRQCKLLPETERLDCYPSDSVNAEKCESRGCCFIPAKTKPRTKNPLNVPYCFYPPNYNAYAYINSTNTAFGVVVYMKRNFRSGYPDDVETLKMIVKYESDARLHVKIVDPLNSRFETPYPEVPIVDRATSDALYRFQVDLVKTGFQVVRKSDNTTIFDASNFVNLIYANQFLQISTTLPSKYIYGIGEHRANLLLSTEWSQYTLFNHDAIPQFNTNLYGSHPFYMMIENSTNSHGVFLLNSNAMDVIIQPTPAITFRSIGGILEFYFFMGPTPADVVQQYTQLVGLPFLPPYWGLGFHLCRFGYKTLNNTEAVMQRNIDAGIPLDTQWNDLDYMDNSNDFTYDKINFKNLPQFVKKLHQKGMHYIPLIDPGVSASEQHGSYPPYDTGIKMDIFVKNSSNQPFVGKVWNRKSTVWPDFTHPNTVVYWTDMLKQLHKEVEFDGAWIDMNEPSNFLSGAFNGCPNNSLEYPPYVPKVDGGTLNYKTMCMNAKHYVGEHYNVHNLYGFAEAIVTSFAMAEIRGKRPMVISRSTFAGHGHYAGHWSGDVWSQWLDMKHTVPQLLTFSMLGIPLMGADICGFNGNTTEALCNRWMQLGAFYPFSRNHNTDDGVDQDPAFFGTGVIESSKKALLARYSLLPYLYTLFWRAHNYGETVARPLFFEFTKDANTLSIDGQFLWGPGLLIVPVLTEGDVYVSAYLPEGIWYDFYTRQLTKSTGQYLNISAPLDTIPLFIRGGYILPQQSPKQTTTESRKSLIDLIVASDDQQTATGELYWDDGDSLNTFEENMYSLIKFNMEQNTLRITNQHWNKEYPPNLGSVVVLGLEKPVSHVTVNTMPRHFEFDTVHNYLVIDQLNMSFSKSITITWEY